MKPQKIAQALKERGGIEKIIRDARAASARPPTESNNWSRPQQGVNPPQDVSKDDLPTDERSNDKKISIPIWMRLSQRDELLEGTKFTLSIRVKGPSALELIKIKQSSKAPKSDIFSDW